MHPHMLSFYLELLGAFFKLILHGCSTQAVRRRLGLPAGFLPVEGSASGTETSTAAPLPLPFWDLGFFGTFFPDAEGFFEAPGVLGFLGPLGALGLVFGEARLASFNMDLRMTMIEGWGTPTIYSAFTCKDSHSWVDI